MIESGEVVEVAGDIAKIKFIRTSACGKCNACGFKKNKSEVTIEVKNTISAKKGDNVSVKMASGSIFKASVYAYIFPLSMLLLGLAGGYILGGYYNIFGNAEIFAAICGIVLTAASFLVIKATEPYLKKRMKRLFTMETIIKEQKGKENGR